MKNVLILVCSVILTATLSGFLILSSSPSIYMTKTGYVHFKSEAPLELIEAENKSVSAVLDVSKKSVAFKVPITLFKGFNSPLQHEHFNENYMEINQYPSATFNGKIIEDIDFSKPGSYKVRAKGMLNIHGIEKERIIPGNITVGATSIKINSDFEVPLVDHDIKIPKVVNQKIAEVIFVELKTELTPQ